MGTSGIVGAKNRAVTHSLLALALALALTLISLLTSPSSVPA
jgi:hypothetical protein